MEYTVLLEQKRRKIIFWVLASLALIICYGSYYFLGLYAMGAYLMLIGCFIVSPLFLGKYKFFLFSWIFIIPLFDRFHFLAVGTTSLITYMLTGLSVPIAFIVFFQKLPEVTKKIPEIIFMFLFLLVLGLNALRPGYLMSSVSEVLSYYIQIFVIFCLYVYLKQGNSYEEVFKWFNIFVILNSLAAFFQRLTGFGLMHLEGVARVSGFLGHPNAFAFLLNIYLPLGIYKVLTVTEKKEKRFWIAGVVMGFLSLIITLSKTSYLLFGLMFLILFFYLPVRLKTRILAVSGILTISFIVVDFLFGLQIIQHIIDRFGNTSSMSWREKVWGFLWYGITHSNLFLGNGIDTSRFFLIPYVGLTWPHNIYLQMLYEYGIWSIFYFIVYIMLGIKFLRATISKKVKDRMFYLVPLIIIVEIIVDMYVSNSVLLRSTMYFGWVILIVFCLQLNGELNAKKCNRLSQ